MQPFVTRLGLGLALAASSTLPVSAGINTVDAVPAATLLLPHFQVDPAAADGVRTSFTLGNASPAEQLAHVTLWTDRGVPTRTFDVRLPGYGVVDVDLRALFVSGTLPASSAGGFATCAASLPAPPLDATALTGLRNAHTGLGSSLLGGQCGGATHGDGIARGYVTVDVVSACSSAVPGDAGYFVNGGAGIARNDNVLWGQYVIHQPALNLAYGDTLVHVQADAAHADTNGAGDYTFYGRRLGGSGADNREALPMQWFGRYSFDEAINRTTAMVWRDPGLVSPFACGGTPAALDTREVVAFDQQENPAGGQDAVPLPLASQSVPLHDPAEASMPFARGVVLYDLALATPAAPFAERNQAFVSHVYASIFGGAGLSQAWPVNPITQSFAYGFDPGPPPVCSDGIDNDSDGATDFPADIGCSNPNDFDETNAACSDGIDNDSDGATDFPADIGCIAANDIDESNPACSDGIDNDGDTFVDFPADAGCTHALSTIEAPACSDGTDNDGDTLTDHPADTQCSSPADHTEDQVLQCQDGVDNDGDGQTDFPADAHCSGTFDNQEAQFTCSDGVDNDGDTFIDFPADPGCAAANSNNESPQCDDGNDNDGDTFIDFPADMGCSARSDTQENTPACSDGFDNDGDGQIDFPNENSCAAPGDTTEAPDCSDTIDNDLDGVVDFGADPGCASAADLNELVGTVARACSDGIDNDNDGLNDFPADAGCSSAWDDVEFDTAGKAPVIDVLPDTLPGGNGGVAYSQQLSAVGGVGPFTFALTAGTLPPGLTLSADGLIDGVPTAGGSFAFTVQATDSNGFQGTQAYTVQIVAPVIDVLPDSLPGGVQGSPYAQQLSATGGNAPYTFALAGGTLPPGLTLSASGLLSGAPTAAGAFAFTVSATDGDGFSGTQAYSLGIVNGAPAQLEVIPTLHQAGLLLLAALMALGAGLAWRRR